MDFDVHHGNGTQDILGRTYDPRVLFISVHASGPGEPAPPSGGGGGGGAPVFPGTGGAPGCAAHANVMNLPMGPKVRPGGRHRTGRPRPGAAPTQQYS